ncbi:MAG: hypothetical protein JO079_07475 [Frankiaceae bacterium]|nr:hypothetical protein [Frankiaceae bacterium]MBV9368922.1 hypothetical protein [Frankiales bacterium]
MPSTATPPPPPPAVSYPPPPPPPAVEVPAAPPAGGHGHLNGTKIGLIAGGGVAVIGGIVAVIALTGHHGPNNPPAPPPVPVPVNSPAQPAPQPSQPTQPTDPGSPEPSSPEPSSPDAGSPTPESSQPAAPSDQGGSGLDLGNGASLKPASGWKVQGTGKHSVSLLSPNSDAEYFAAGGAAKEHDAATQLQDDAQAYVSSNSALSNVKVGQVSNQQVSGSAGFTSVATMPFQATLTTNQGTTQVVGIFYELFNPQGYSVLSVFDAVSEDAYKAAAPDADAMTSSILG